MNTAVLIVITIGCVIATALLVHAEYQGDTMRRRITKIAASSCFVFLLVAGGASGVYATWIGIGLVLGALGDVALLGEDRRALLAGIVLFLAGHIAYIVGFALGGELGAAALIGGAACAAIGIAVGRAVWPTAGSLRGAVACYIIVIVAMVTAAIASGRGVIIVGGLLFFASDLAVARQRFVKKSFSNRAIGLPLYYAGQLLIAWSAIA